MKNEPETNVRLWFGNERQAVRFQISSQVLGKLSKKACSPSKIRR